MTNGAERCVYHTLTDELQLNDLVIPNQRVTDHLKDHEIDFVVAIEGAGIVCLEVKGGVARALANEDAADTLTCSSSTSRRRSNARGNACTSGYPALGISWWCARTRSSSGKWVARILLAGCSILGVEG